MTKADIVDEIARATGLTKIETKAVVDGVFASIIKAIADGRRIELRGFGVFKHKSRKPRMARNPKTGELVPLDKRYVPIFKPSPDFLNRVNEAMKLQLEEKAS
ncbi:MAG: integration host factor subunit beta [Candidatus Kapabacteria bacterium]|jgi:nucleoid DNA-binding protein|nr:integration host factor subunit beta [Candidatus Kapabacteria bacterium]